jgi:hypothetical protein
MTAARRQTVRLAATATNDACVLCSQRIERAALFVAGAVACNASNGIHTGRVRAPVAVRSSMLAAIEAVKKRLRTIIIPGV